MQDEATLNEVLGHARDHRAKLEEQKIELCLDQAAIAAKILATDKLIDFLVAMRLEYAIITEESPSMVERLSRMRRDP